MSAGVRIEADRSVSARAPDDEALPFLARWSRRKRGLESAEAADALRSECSESPVTASMVTADADPDHTVVGCEAAATGSAAPAERIDPRTGKPMSELTDEDMPDLETLDQDSDLSAFMAEKVSQALRMRALTRVFHSAKFNKVCLCAEYADDYTNFTPLGEIVPHDLKQAIVREGGKLLQRFAERGLKITPDEAEARAAAEFRGERVPEPDWAQIAMEAEQPGVADQTGDESGSHDGDKNDDSEMLHPLTPQQATQKVLRADPERA